MPDFEQGARPLTSVLRRQCDTRPVRACRWRPGSDELAARTEVTLGPACGQVRGLRPGWLAASAGGYGSEPQLGATRVRQSDPSTRHGRTAHAPGLWEGNRPLTASERPTHRAPRESRPHRLTAAERPTRGGPWESEPPAPCGWTARWPGRGQPAAVYGPAVSGGWWWRPRWRLPARRPQRRDRRGSPPGPPGPGAPGRALGRAWPSPRRLRARAPGRGRRVRLPA